MIKQTHSQHNPLISVIIPVKGRVAIFKEAIESVYNQTYKNIEVIVAESDSEEDIKKIINCFKLKGLDITHLQVANNGISFSRNQAIKKASGEYIAFLDSDDLWEPNKIETQILEYKKNPYLGLLYHDAISFDNNHQVPEHSYFYYNGAKPYRGFCFKDLYTKYNIIPTSSVMIKKDVLKQTGLFDECLEANEDRDLWIRISQKYSIDYIDKPLGKYRYNFQNICNIHGLMQKEVEKVLKKYSDYYRKNYETSAG